MRSPRVRTASASPRRQRQPRVAVDQRVDLAADADRHDGQVDGVLVPAVALVEAERLRADLDGDGDVVELDRQRHGHHREREAERRHRPAHQLGQLRPEPREAGWRRRAVVGRDVALAGADAQPRPLHAHLDRAVAPVARAHRWARSRAGSSGCSRWRRARARCPGRWSRFAAAPPVSSARLRSISADSRRFCCSCADGDTPVASSSAPMCRSRPRGSKV